MDWFDPRIVRRWLVIVGGVFVVGVGDYLLTNASGDWKESAVKALGAGLVASWPVIRNALLQPPPGNDALG